MPHSKISHESSASDSLGLAQQTNDGLNQSSHKEIHTCGRLTNDKGDTGQERKVGEK